MRKILFVPVLLLFFVVTAFQCNKSKNECPEGGCLKGVLIDDMCGSIIIKITGGTYDPSRVEASWNDPHTGNTYQNVFTVTNYCDIQGRLTKGQEFYFYFKDNFPPPNCFVCLAIRLAPAKKNIISITSSL